MCSRKKVGAIVAGTRATRGRMGADEGRGMGNRWRKDLDTLSLILWKVQYLWEALRGMSSSKLLGGDKLVGEQ